VSPVRDPMLLFQKNKGLECLACCRHQGTERPHESDATPREPAPCCGENFGELEKLEKGRAGSAPPRVRELVSSLSAPMVIEQAPLQRAPGPDRREWKKK
jgi:hypothetical protein